MSLLNRARRAMAQSSGRVKTGFVGTQVRIPDDLLRARPCLGDARWRRGGLPLRIGGWMLGQRSVAGITLWRTVFLHPDVPLSSNLLLHELGHVRQFTQDKSFPLRYLWETIRRGYSGNRYELEAEEFAQAVVRGERG